MLQGNEYGKNQALARVLVRACHETFRPGPNTCHGPGAAVLVLPALDGVSLPTCVGASLPRHLEPV